MSILSEFGGSGNVARAVHSVLRSALAEVSVLEEERKGAEVGEEVREEVHPTPKPTHLWSWLANTVVYGMQSLPMS